MTSEVEHKTVEDAVLGVYRKVSPSFMPMESSEDFKNQLNNRLNVLFEMGLSPQSFKGKRLVEIGGGTGENCLFYALWGAEVTIVEPNEISCERAEKLFEQYDVRNKLTVVNQSFYEIDHSMLKDFDLVFCEGVLHHTYDPEKGISLVLENMSSGSLFMLSIAETNGWHKRQLQRQLVKKLAGEDEKENVRLSKKYFQEHIDRAVKYGFRSEDTVIYDTWVNPQIQPVDFKNICNLFQENNFFHLGSYPSIKNPNVTTPWSQEKQNAFNYEANRGYYSQLEKVWRVCGEESYEEVMQKGLEYQYDTNSLSDHLNQIEDVIEKADESLLDKTDLTPIQRGYMGLGLSFYLGLKL